MSNPQHKLFNFPNDSFDADVSGVYSALNFIAGESKKFGLWFTSHLIEVAALSALAEYEKIQDKEKLTPDQTFFQNQ